MANYERKKTTKKPAKKKTATKPVRPVEHEPVRRVEHEGVSAAPPGPPPGPDKPIDVKMLITVIYGSGTSHFAAALKHLGPEGTEKLAEFYGI